MSAETRDARLVRNAISILRSLDRDEIEPCSTEQWSSFRDDPYRGFLRASDARRGEIWAAIQRRLPADLQEALSASEAERVLA